jgi:hypothetical protein
MSISLSFLDRGETDLCFETIVDANEKRISSLTCPDDVNLICKQELACISNYFLALNKTFKDMPEKVQILVKQLVNYMSTREIKWGTPLDNVPSDRIVDCLKDTDFKDSASQELSNGHMCCVLSFEPANGCTPSVNGIYGVMRISGTFDNEKQAMQKAKDVIKRFPANNLFIVHTGCPFFLTRDEKYFSGTTHVRVGKSDEQIPMKSEHDIINMYDFMASKIIEEKRKEKEINDEIAKRVQVLEKDVKDQHVSDVEQLLVLFHKICCSAMEFQNLKRITSEIVEKHNIQSQQAEDLMTENPNLFNEAMVLLNVKNKEIGIEENDDEQSQFVKDNLGKTFIISE